MRQLSAVVLFAVALLSGCAPTYQIVQKERQAVPKPASPPPQARGDVCLEPWKWRNNDWACDHPPELAAPEQRIVQPVYVAPVHVGPVFRPFYVPMPFYGPSYFFYYHRR